MRPQLLVHPRSALSICCVLLCGAHARAQQLVQRVRPIGVGGVRYQAHGAPAGKRQYVGSLTTTPTARICRAAFDSGWSISPGAHIELVSALDGAMQLVDSASLAAWGGAGAAMNGSRIDVYAVSAGPEDRSRFSISSVMTYESEGDAALAVCGADDRAADTRLAIGRLSLLCTAFTLNTGVVVSAGHCGVTNGDFVEFNVPASWNDGTPRAAHPDDQYPVDVQTIVDGGQDDWVVFRVGANSNTGLVPREAYGDFFYVGYLRQAGGGQEALVSGFGIDTVPSGSRGNRNQDSQTLQSASGLITTLVGGGQAIDADTDAGSAGSPVFPAQRRIAWGMVVSNTACANRVLWLWTPSLNQVLGTFPVGMIAADGSFTGTQDGSLERPFRTFRAAANAVRADGVIGLLPWSQAYDGSITISTRCTIIAPSGPVTIGH